MGEGEQGTFWKRTEEGRQAVGESRSDLGSGGHSPPPLQRPRGGWGRSGAEPPRGGLGQRDGLAGLLAAGGQ